MKDLLFEDLSRTTFDETVRLEDIDGLSGATNDVWVWLRRIYFTGELELIGRLLVKSGLVGAGSEVPEFLLRRFNEKLLKDASITFGDLQRLDHRALGKFLGAGQNDAAAADDAMVLTHFRRCGSAGHRLAEFLYEGPFNVGEPSVALMAERPAEQIALFDYRKSRPLPPERPEGLFGFTPLATEFSARQLSYAQWDELDAASCALEALADMETFTRTYSARREEIAEFERMFAWSFRRHERMLPSDGPPMRFLRLVSLLGWTGIIRMRLEEAERAIYFTEFPVLPRSFEVWAGRMDRLDLFPNGSRAALKDLRRRDFGSALELVEPVRKFHGDVRFRVVDWKFAVGDHRDRMIGATDELPFNVHVSQVQWYMLWLALAEYLRCGSQGEWPDSSHLSGELRYVLPSGRIVPVPVNPAPEELRDRFRREVVGKWRTISAKRDHRVLSNRTVQFLKDEVFLNGNGHNHTNGRGTLTEIAPASTDPVRSFFELAGAMPPVSAFVDAFREFKDKRRLVEVVQTKKGERLRLHLSRLVTAIAEGKVEVKQNFSWDRGGFVCCLLHEENTPSMHLNFLRGTWKCFGCGAFGAFDRHGLPKHVLAAMPSAQEIERRKPRAMLEVPDLCRRIMRDARQILEGAFPWSPAEPYLRNARKIDPGFAQKAGAGWGDNGLIAGLLERGYTFEDLVQHSFINFSERASGDGAVPRLLRRHGVSPDVFVKRRTKVSALGKTRREVVEFPFPVLTGFITFPLELPLGAEAVTVGFYGRKVPRDNRPVGFKHIIVESLDVPEGMFGGGEVADWISEGGLEKVFLAEAPIDALVLRLLGYGVAVASCGTSRPHVEQLLAGFNPSEINIAQDFDSAGRDATARIEASLRKKGYEGEIVDFSSVFAAAHPEVARYQCDDFGRWWELCS